jgi:hypothetical protein
MDESVSMPLLRPVIRQSCVQYHSTVVQRVYERWWRPPSCGLAIILPVLETCRGNGHRLSSPKWLWVIKTGSAREINKLSAVSFAA